MTRRGNRPCPPMPDLKRKKAVRMIGLQGQWAHHCYEIVVLNTHLHLCILYTILIPLTPPNIQEVKSHHHHPIEVLITLNVIQCYLQYLDQTKSLPGQQTDALTRAVHRIAHHRMKLKLLHQVIGHKKVRFIKACGMEPSARSTNLFKYRCARVISPTQYIVSFRSANPTQIIRG